MNGFFSYLFGMPTYTNEETKFKNEVGKKIDTSFKFGVEGDVSITDYSKQFDTPGSVPTVFHLANGQHALMKKGTYWSSRVRRVGLQPHFTFIFLIMFTDLY